MKTLGIIGGMSYESSAHYYQRINDQVNERAGGLTCAKMLLYNVDFEPIRQMMLAGDWDGLGQELSSIAKTLEAAGADCVAVATNTMHKCAGVIADAVSIPLIHIADCVALKCAEAGVGRVGLLGTRYTMEEDFLSGRLRENGLEVFTPPLAEEIDDIDRIIFGELCKGQVLDASRQRYVQIIEKMVKEQGIEGVILGCTEIEMLIKPGDVSVPVFDTTQAHIDVLSEISLGIRPL